MQRGFQLGLLLLVVQLFQEGLDTIPVVTFTVLLFNVYLYMLPVAPLEKVCMNLQLVYEYKEWGRFFLSPLHHVDDLHLYINMASFLWKGIWLERRLGGAWFLYMLLVFFLLTGVVYLLLQALLLKLMVDSQDPLVGLIHECVVGFSGVVFALKVVNNHYDPGGETYMLMIRVSNRFASWVELVLIYLIAPRTSVIAHLAGILVGLLYTVGPLETIMRTCAGLNMCYSGVGRQNPQHADYSRRYYPSAERESDISGMTEEEQIEMAIRNSLNERGRARQRHFQRPTEEEVALEELRRNRLKRLEQLSNQTRRRI
ncbi:rhomboid-related protein 4-like [Tautogolabrus adspersus]